VKYLKTYKIFESSDYLESIRQDIEDIFISSTDDWANIELKVYLSHLQGYRGDWSDKGKHPVVVIEIIGAEPGGGYGMRRDIYNEIRDSYHRSLEYIKGVLIENDVWLGYISNSIHYSFSSYDDRWPHESLNKFPSDFRKIRIQIPLINIR
jgi:hypothetical protein